ncbi:MAG: protein translocase subunit SecF [Actinomycetota bacterium]
MAGLRDIVRGEAHFNIIGRFRMWAMISGVVLLASLGGLFGRGLNLSLDFEGGTSFTVPLTSSSPLISEPDSKAVQDTQSALSRFNLGDVRPQLQQNRTTGLKELFVRMPHITEATTRNDVQQALANLAGQPSINEVNLTDVGPSWGHQVSSKALRGLIVFLILVTIYISVRFEPKMAVGAFVALMHDLLATAGIYALLGITVTPATIIALLTLLGYSLYDTVVVFDKIKENVGASGSTGRQSYTDVVNDSVNKVLMRSINTSLSTLLPIGALLFVGVLLFHASTLEDLAVALFIGTIVGTYSSIFIASPILAVLKEREPRYKAVRARIESGDFRGVRQPPARAQRPAGATAPQPQAAVAVEDAPERPVSQPIRVQRAAPKPRKKKKKKKRR